MRKYIILICLLGSIYLTSCSCSFSIDHERQEHVTITNADDENSGQYNSPQNTSQKEEEEDDNNADDETNTDEDLNQSEKQTKDNNIQDGDHQATITYYNPNTGTNSTYTLMVNVEDGELQKIGWPNGGWLDDSHFTPTDITTGFTSFVSDTGAEYTVTIDK